MAKKTTTELKNDPVQQPAPPEEDMMSEGQEQAEEIVRLTKAEFETARAHIENLQKEKDEAIAVAQRLQADFDNYRKRNANLKVDSYEEGMRDCVRALLPTLDCFDRALENVQGVDPCFADGIRLVQRMLLDSLGKLGLQEVPADGAFDPELHEAVMKEAAEGRNAGDILSVLQKGYEVKGRILRHSMVKIAE